MISQPQTERTPAAVAIILAGLGALLCCANAGAHHGVASLGAVGLQGPGAPLEASTAATLPAGRLFAFAKLDYARYETYTAGRDGEKDVNAFFLYGAGYGVTSYLSAYAILPFTSKRTEDSSYTTAGFGDAWLMAALGLAWDGRLHAVPGNESLDDLEDLHLGLYGGASLPTGDADRRDAGGAIDPGMSLGFGKPAFTGGITATKMLGARTTACAEASAIGFQENTYADGSRVRFGTELRVNAALAQRLLTDPERALRLDANIEANFLSLGRDRSGGEGERATGGRVLYTLPGLRLFVSSVSVGAGVKVPVWTDLHEENEQQGAEGRERYRLVFSFSSLL